MSSYAMEELVSSSNLVKNFSSYVSKVKNHEVEKIWILKNNKLDAVLISSQQYEMFQEMMEHFEIYTTLQQRDLNQTKTISLEEMAQKHNISL